MDARAQQRALPVIGFLSSGDQTLVAAFRRGIGEQGYVEGENVEVLYRYAETQYDRLPGFAADLVRRRVAVIFAWGLRSALAAKAATTTTPIVFSTGADPVEARLVASLNRPGGNVTGAVFLSSELAAKRLELLREIVPTAPSTGYLYNPAEQSEGFAFSVAEIKVLEAAARALSVRVVTAKASTPSEIETAFAMRSVMGLALS
jgi:putative ABC transport system substrate-binding protein